MIVKGQLINDRYKILKNIGEGGMANVYLALDTILDREVAIKILRGDSADDPKFVRRFQREALSASSLSHPNIVEMYDVGQDYSEDDPKYYIVMEYIEGKTLKQLIKKRGALTISEVLDIMLQLTEGLGHAHASYIIHRDIKPQNIMILENGGVKITDFGIAVALNGTQLTQTNSVMGSVHYIPPEQANGTGSTVKSDIYSLGIMMYELLTGKLPFKGDNAVEIALKHMKNELPSIKKTNPQIPQSIENVIIKATAKNPKNRYEDAKEMHEDLKTVLDSNRVNEPKYTYKYPEFIDEPKSKLKNKKEEGNKISKKVKEKSGRKNKLLIMAIIAFSILSFIVLFITIILPKMTKVPDVKIPDVSNVTVLEAEQTLESLGLEVATYTEKQNSDEVEEGYIIKTEPQAGRSVKKGTVVTLYESTGVLKLVLENYVGQNYIDIKTRLETEYGIYVLIEPEETTDSDAKEGEILKQDPLEGIILKKNGTFTLYVANLVDEYPDMVAEEWYVSDVEVFAEEYNITVVYREQESSDYAEGRVITQSRAPKTKIIDGSTLIVTIATAPVPEVNTNE